MIFQSNKSNQKHQLLQKGQWTIEEDNILLDWINTYGPKRWTLCSNLLKCRSPKQIRDRWINTLSPNIKKGEWSIAEDYIIFKLYNEIGSKWNFMCNYIPSRSGNSIKNRFYSTLRRHALGNVKKYNVTSELIIKMKTKDLLVYLSEAYTEKTIKIDEIIKRYSNDNSDYDNIDNDYHVIKDNHIQYINRENEDLVLTKKKKNKTKLKHSQEYQNKNKSKKLIIEKRILENVANKEKVFNIKYLNNILMKENLLITSSKIQLDINESVYESDIDEDVDEDKKNNNYIDEYNKDYINNTINSCNENDNRWYEYIRNKRSLDRSDDNDYIGNYEMNKEGYNSNTTILDMKNCLDFNDIYDRHPRRNHFDLLVDELNEIEKKFVEMFPRNNIFELYGY